MSLYYLQKCLYQLNRDPRLQAQFTADSTSALDDYDLTAEERSAVVDPDVGLLYVLGVNGQILMHFAAFRGLAWDEYLQAMRDGIARHGPVREGLYTLAGEARAAETFGED